MGMLVGGSKGAAFTEMNVVPLIDILLVLLVIFMSMPSQQKGLQTAIPQPRPTGGQNEPIDVIVVQVLSNGELQINQEPVSWDQLAVRLDQVFQERARKVAFIRGQAPVEFARVARVVDILHGRGVSVGLLTPGLEQSR
jgi:biopolymer transport protein ExbD